jgi:hypothetical protein
MAAWHRSRRADLGLRGTGLLLCWTSYGAIARLAALHVAPPSAGALAYGLAAAGFLAASAGGALTALGRHLFDQIEVGSRQQDDAASRSPVSAATPPTAFGSARARDWRVGGLAHG